MTASGISFAQSSVSIYGRLDVGMNNQKTTGTTTIGSASTSTFYKGNNLVNEDGLSTGLLGFKGTEDLGGGLKANFVHEMDLDLDVGALGVAAGRDSTLGLSGGFGEIRLGRSYTPLYSTIGASDVFGTTGAGTVNQFGMAANAVRASNAFFYASPSFSGLTVRLMAQQNNAQTNASVGGAGKTSGNGFSVTYAAGPLMLAAATGTEKGSSIDRAGALFAATAAAATTAGTATANANAKYTGSAISGQYDMGVAKFFVGYTTTKDDNDTSVAGGELTMKETNFGVAVPMGALTLMAAVGNNKGSMAGEPVTAKGTDMAVGATYALSKRTTAYFKTGTYNKYKASDVGGSEEVKTTRTSVGLRHLF
ncbi:porin [Limnohabitans parvus]|uniref:porin n=1 Tax=Limnohabitans parvus TaxID=540061 RepID=UPI00142E726E|nr:porin [Limnohabitans parvus]